jgi:hypothetical protein
MNLTFDRNLFTDGGLDSGSLTMLGSVIHTFREAGEYKGTVRRGDAILSTFYLSADKNSAIAQVNIDLAALTEPKSSGSSAKCCHDHKGDQHRFVVNPRGYAVFHVSGGKGGYYVHTEKVIEGKDTDQRVFDSRKLSDADVFSGTIIRPGTYSVTNLLTKARAEVVVSYPVIGKTAYRPPAPVRVKSSKDYLEPKRVELKPGQGLLFDCETPSRIKIELEKADDGPKQKREAVVPGWKKRVLPKVEKKT